MGVVLSRTFAYYVWKVEIAIRNLLALLSQRFRVGCQYCEFWDSEKHYCEIFEIHTAEFNNCVYFKRKKERDGRD